MSTSIRFASVFLFSALSAALCTRIVRADSVPVMELSGALLQALDPNSKPYGMAWHTSEDPAARPLAVALDADPTKIRRFPLRNREEGEIQIPLTVGSHVLTLFWQYDPALFPPGMVLNLYFKGDTLNPGLSAVVQYRYGFANFRANLAPMTLSLYLREVDNSGSLSYDDGKLRAALVTAFYMPSGGLSYQWRPSDFTNVDRVGALAFGADGAPDGVMLLHVIVEPSSQPAPRAKRPPPQPTPAAARVVDPLRAKAGQDLWRVPTKAPLETPGPPDDAQSAQAREQKGGGKPSDQSLQSPTPNGTGVPDETPTAADTPAAGDTTLTPDSSRSPAAQVTPTPRTVTPQPTAIVPATQTPESDGMRSPTADARATPTARRGRTKRERR